MKGSEVLVKTLINHDVEYIFGLPGDTSLGWYESLYDYREQITHVLTTDERNAVYMAEAYAKIAKKPGICEGPSGGGATYMLPGIYEANGSSISLIAMNTDIPHTIHGKATLTEIDQVNLFEAATKWSVRVDQVDRIPEFIRKAFRVATTGKPGAVHLAFPVNVMNCSVDKNVNYEKKNFQFLKFPAERVAPPERDLKAALDLIFKSERPFIIAGGGVHISGAYEPLEKFSTAIGSPLGTSITGKGSIDERHPLSVGVIGENGGNGSSDEIIMNSDLIIFVGTQTGSVVTCHWQIPPDDGSRKIIQIDIDPREIGRNYNVDVGLVGDVKTTLERLVDMSHRKIETRTAAATRLIENLKTWKEKEVERVEDATTAPIHPLSIVKICEDLLPKNCIFTVDAGTPTPYFASYYRTRAERKFLIPRAHGALGYAIPAVVGAHKADKSARVVALTGDGSMLMSMAELITISREEIPAIIILFHNDEYSWIKTGIKYLKNQKYLSVDIPTIEYDKIAESFGFASFIAENADEFKESLKRALNEEKPTFIDAKTIPLHEVTPSTLPWRIGMKR